MTSCVLQGVEVEDSACSTGGMEADRPQGLETTSGVAQAPQLETAPESRPATPSSSISEQMPVSSKGGSTLAPGQIPMGAAPAPCLSEEISSQTGKVAPQPKVGLESNSEASDAEVMGGSWGDGVGEVGCGGGLPPSSRLADDLVGLTLGVEGGGGKSEVTEAGAVQGGLRKSLSLPKGLLMRGREVPASEDGGGGGEGLAVVRAHSSEGAIDSSPFSSLPSSIFMEERQQGEIAKTKQSSA